MQTAKSDLFRWVHPAQQDAEAALKIHVADAALPCVGAKAALAKGTLSVLACSRIDSLSTPYPF